MQLAFKYHDRKDAEKLSSPLVYSVSLHAALLFTLPMVSVEQTLMVRSYQIELIAPNDRLYIPNAPSDPLQNPRLTITARIPTVRQPDPAPFIHKDRQTPHSQTTPTKVTNALANDGRAYATSKVKATHQIQKISKLSGVDADPEEPDSNHLEPPIPIATAEDVETTDPPEGAASEATSPEIKEEIKPDSLPTAPQPVLGHTVTPAPIFVAIPPWAQHKYCAGLPMEQNGVSIFDAIAKAFPTSKLSEKSSDAKSKRVDQPQIPVEFSTIRKRSFVFVSCADDGYSQDALDQFLRAIDLYTTDSTKVGANTTENEKVQSEKLKSLEIFQHAQNGLIALSKYEKSVTYISKYWTEKELNEERVIRLGTDSAKKCEIEACRMIFFALQRDWEKSEAAFESFDKLFPRKGDDAPYYECFAKVCFDAEEYDLALLSLREELACYGTGNEDRHHAVIALKRMAGIFSTKGEDAIAGELSGLASQCAINKTAPLQEQLSSVGTITESLQLKSRQASNQ